MRNVTPIIYIVDDDNSVRRALERLVRSSGMSPRVFSSAREFLDSDYTDEGSCLIIDIKMPGLNGLKLQQELSNRGSELPVIFITAFDDEETRNRAKEGGAAGYFRKPVDDQALLDSIKWALSRE